MDHFTGGIPALGQRAYGLIGNQVLIAIPVFVLVGAILEKSRIAEELLDTMGRSFGQLRGGLGISVVLVGALLAASTGIVGATVVAMGLIALPTMLKAGYKPSLAAGIVCTAGTLGQIIPPSTLLIILADVMSNSYQQAQYEQGKFSVEALSVGQFFAAAIIPGLMLVTIYLLYILIRGYLRPQDMPAADLGLAKPARAGGIRIGLPSASPRSTARSNAAALSVVSSARAPWSTTLTVSSRSRASSPLPGGGGDSERRCPGCAPTSAL